MPGNEHDDLEPIDEWPSAPLEPLTSLDEDPEDSDDHLPELPELSPLPALSLEDLASSDPEHDEPLPELPLLVADVPSDLGPAVVVLPWQTQATVDGLVLPATLCPSEPNSVLQDPSATDHRRTATITLGPVSVTVEVLVLQKGPARLCVGRDVLGSNILVSSTVG